jgi:hypothetical protein
LAQHSEHEEVRQAFSSKKREREPEEEELSPKKSKGLQTTDVSS